MKIYIAILLLFCCHSVLRAEQTNIVSQENYPSGKIKTVVVQLSQTNSVEREYYESGQLRWEISIGANGKKNGIARFYYPDGKLESVWKHTDNRSEPLKKYTENGRRKWFVRTKWRIGKITHKIGNLFVPPSP
jgi:hypothetical protein